MPLCQAMKRLALMVGISLLMAVSAAVGGDAPVEKTVPEDKQDISALQNRPRVVVLKPVIVCDDDGSHSAPYALPKKLVDRVYTKAGLEFLYLEPVRWNLSRARRGEFTLDEIVREGRKQGIIGHDPRIVTLLFVSAVGTNPGPLGRGQQNGSICFVALGPEGEKSDPAMQAFVVAHEVGHCLNLRHAVDDPDVPDDVPNLQGDGPFEERLAVAGLHDTQRETVLRSPLVMERVLFHDLEQGRRLIVDEAWEPYITQATDNMLRFSVGLAADAPVPQEPVARKEFANAKYREKVLEFNGQEQEMLKQAVSRLDSLVATQWPCITRLPWHFIKVDSSFCAGMPHTRGLAIVLPEAALRRIAQDQAFGLKLLLHEKLHVVQRLNAPRFTSLYEAYGFQPVTIAASESDRLGLAQNPDAFRLNWGIPRGEKQISLITTRLKTDDNGKFAFRAELRDLNTRLDGSFDIGEVREEDATFLAWRDSFPIKTGHDHPNEVSAYLATILLERDFLRSEASGPSDRNQHVDQTRTAFQQALRILGD